MLWLRLVGSWLVRVIFFTSLLSHPLLSGRNWRSLHSAPEPPASAAEVAFFFNFDQDSRFNFITSTKHQQKKTPAANLAWTSTSKSWPNLLLWTKSLAFWPNLSFEICNKLLPTQSSSATVTTSTSFELASLHTWVASIKFTKQQSVSQLVS